MAGLASCRNTASVADVYIALLVPLTTEEHPYRASSLDFRIFHALTDLWSHSRMIFVQKPGKCGVDVLTAGLPSLVLTPLKLRSVTSGGVDLCRCFPCHPQPSLTTTAKLLAGLGKGSQVI